jgi:translation initiation factor IF-2
VIAYQVEINKALRGILDLEDAMLTKDLKAAEAAMKALKAMEKAGHKVFKPRRRRGGAKK